MPSLSYADWATHPLLTGLSALELLGIATSGAFNDEHAARGAELIRAGLPCKRLIFLMNGTATVRHEALDGALTVEEDIAAPYLFEPERLFGLTAQHALTATAATPCTLLTVAKPQLLALTQRHDIVHFNFLNLLSAHAQRLAVLAASPNAPGTPRTISQTRPTGTTGTPSAAGLRAHIIGLLARHTLTPTGRKVFLITVHALALHVHAPWRRVASELKAMAADGLVTLRRGIITVPEFAKL